VKPVPKNSQKKRSRSQTETFWVAKVWLGGKDAFKVKRNIKQTQQQAHLTNYLALIALAVSASTIAEVDGSLDGTQSLGSADVTLDVTEVVQVTFPNGDIPVAFSTTVDSSTTEEFCIYTNAGDGTVGVAIGVLNDNSAGASQSAVLKSGSDEIEYSVDFNEADGTSIAAAINEDGMTEVSTDVANNTSADCSTGGLSH